MESLPFNRLLACVISSGYLLGRDRVFCINLTLSSLAAEKEFLHQGEKFLPNHLRGNKDGTQSGSSLIYPNPEDKQGVSLCCRMVRTISLILDRLAFFLVSAVSFYGNIMMLPAVVKTCKQSEIPAYF